MKKTAILKNTLQLCKPEFIRKITIPLLLLLLFSANSIAQNITVKGRVVNESGQPVQRPSIFVKGTSNGITGDDNGNFSIAAPGNSTLVISAVNFTTLEVRVNNKTTLDITLVSTEKTLGEVVVTGYGTQRRKDVTGAVASVKGEVLREVPAPNIIAQLKGRTAGVDIVSNSATPGGGGTIRIRGNRSLSNNVGTLDALDAPLIVLDGIPFGGSMNDINPDDVASLEILKDASATAIYGSRGSGGVILISTKRGRTGKPVISYDAYYGTSKIMDKYNLFNGQEYAALKAEAAATAGEIGLSSSYLLTQVEKDALAAGISTDWQDLIYQNGFVTSHNLSVAGGSEGTQYGLSGGYFNETGIIPNQRFERYSLRATIDNQVNRRIKIGINTLNTLTYVNNPGGGGVPVSLMRLTPLSSPYNADGSIVLFPQQGTDAAAVSPLTLKTREDDILSRSRRLRTFNSLYGEVLLAKGLKYRINLGLDYRQEQQDTYDPILTLVNGSTNPTQNRASARNAEAWTYNIQNLLNYDVTVKEKHRIGVTALFETQKDHNKSTGLFGVGLPADYMQNTNIGLATTVSAINPQNAGDNPNSFSERGLISYMGRLNYAYDNRFLLTATFRVDGSSVLSPGHQYFTYPAINAGWNITNEKFMHVDFINSLKVRGGWGKTSNQGINPYATLGALGTDFYNFGQGTAGQQIAYLVTTLPNNALKWQSTAQWNAGLDFSVLKNRLWGSIDVYSHNTKDILLAVSLPPSNGATSTVKNLGKTKGHGLEVNLGSINVQTKSGFTWSTDLNFYFNREEITFLTSAAQTADIGNGWFVGQPITTIYDLKKIGIWQLADSVKGLIAAQTSPVQKPGQIRVEDLNGDHKIDAADRQFIGNFQPKWEGGITNRVSYKGFDLSVVMYARMGMKVLVPYVTTDGSGQGYTFFMQSRNNQLKVDYWTRTNPTDAFPRPDATSDRFLYASTVGYMDGSFIKCRSINLGYEIPQSLLIKAHIQSLRVYVTAVNPFIIYAPFVQDGFGPDPEGNGFGGAIQSQQAGNSVSTPTRQISVNANNPSTRQFNVGINLKF